MNYWERGAVVLGTGLGLTYGFALASTAVEKVAFCPAVHYAGSDSCNQSLWDSFKTEQRREGNLPTTIGGIGMISVYLTTRPRKRKDEAASIHELPVDIFGQPHLVKPALDKSGRRYYEVATVDKLYTHYPTDETEEEFARTAREQGLDYL